MSRWVQRSSAFMGPLLAMAGVLVCSPLLLYPPGRDQSVFLLAGRSLLAGAIPYRDFWDIKPPGLFLAYLLPGSLAFTWPGAAALLDLFALAVAIMAAHRLLTSWGAPLASPPAAILLTGMWAFAADWWDLGQGERLAVPLLILAFLAAGKATTSRWLVAGVCIGCMALLKSSFLPLLLALIPLLPWPRRSSGPAPLNLLMAAFVGVMTPLLIVALALALGGALGAAREATMDFTSHYTQLAWERPDVILRTLRETTWAFLLITWPQFLLAAAALGVAWRRPQLLTGSDDAAAGVQQIRRGVAALGLALLLAAGSLLAQGKFFPYHWIALWPGLILLASLGAGIVGRLAARSRQRAGLIAASVAAGLAALAMTVGLLGDAPGLPGWRAGLAYTSGRITSDTFLSGFRVQKMGYDELVNTVERCAAAMPEEQPILLWGFEPAFYLYAQRWFPGRFPFAYPLITPWAPVAWQAEFLADFDRTPPALIVVRRGDPIPWVAGVGGDAGVRLALFPEMLARLERDYRLRPQLSSPHLQVWQRVAAAAARR